MADPRPLTRNQIAKFVGNDPEAIRAIERLFRVAGELTPSDVVGLQQLIFDNKIDLGTVDNKAEVGLAIAQESVELARLGATAPAPVQDSRVDYLDFNANTPHVSAERRVAWNDFDQTLDIGMAYGVVQQVGLETYARVENATGVEIPNGTVVGFVGVGPGNVLSVAPYIADGSQPTLYVLGVLTHDLPDSGQVGYCATWGHLRDVDTTGAAVGETWAVGDILYVSPVTAGALTNVKPTAPQNVVPVGAVIKASAIGGELFVRPTIEQQQSYGEFTKTGTVSPALADVAYAVSWDVTEIANGVSIVSGSQFTVDLSGLYSFDITLQLSSGNSSDKTVVFWFKKNGVNVANSARAITVSINNGFTPVSLSQFFRLEAADYVELWWRSDSVNVSLISNPASGTAPNEYPVAPAGMATVTQIQL